MYVLLTDGQGTGEQESGWVEKQEVKKEEKQKDLGLDAWNLIFSPNIYGSLEQLLPNH